jgi:hypothetical protein
MANSPAQHAKRRQPSDASCGSTPYGDPKRQRHSYTFDDDESSSHDHESGFAEAMAYSEDLAINDIAESPQEGVRGYRCPGLSRTGEMQQEVEYCPTTDNFGEKVVHDSEGSSSDVVCFGTVSSTSTHAMCTGRYLTQ